MSGTFSTGCILDAVNLGAFREVFKSNSRPWACRGILRSSRWCQSSITKVWLQDWSPKRLLQFFVFYSDEVMGPAMWVAFHLHAKIVCKRNWNPTWQISIWLGKIVFFSNYTEKTILGMQIILASIATSSWKICTAGIHVLNFRPPLYKPIYFRSSPPQRPCSQDIFRIR